MRARACARGVGGRRGGRGRRHRTASVHHCAGRCTTGLHTLTCESGVVACASSPPSRPLPLQTHIDLCSRNQQRAQRAPLITYMPIPSSPPPHHTTTLASYMFVLVQVRGPRVCAADAALPARVRRGLGQRRATQVGTAVQHSTVQQSLCAALGRRGREGRRVACCHHGSCLGPCGCSCRGVEAGLFPFLFPGDGGEPFFCLHLTSRMTSLEQRCTCAFSVITLYNPYLLYRQVHNGATTACAGHVHAARHHPAAWPRPTGLRRPCRRTTTHAQARARTHTHTTCPRPPPPLPACVRRLYDKAMHAVMQKPRQQVVILSQVLVDDVNTGYQQFQSLQVQGAGGSGAGGSGVGV